MEKAEISLTLTMATFLWICVVITQNQKQTIGTISKKKISYTAKETISKTKRQPTEWEKIFANDISNKWLVSKTYKELTQLNTHIHKNK